MRSARLTRQFAVRIPPLLVIGLVLAGCSTSAAHPAHPSPQAAQSSTGPLSPTATYPADPQTFTANVNTCNAMITAADAGAILGEKIPRPPTSVGPCIQYQPGEDTAIYRGQGTDEVEDWLQVMPNPASAKAALSDFSQSQQFADPDLMTEQSATALAGLATEVHYYTAVNHTFDATHADIVSYTYGIIVRQGTVLLGLGITTGRKLNSSQLKTFAETALRHIATGIRPLSGTPITQQ